MKRKTSISVDSEIWRQWLSFVVGMYGSTRKVSEEVEKALVEYMNKERILDADTLRKLLGVKETTYDIDVPDDIIERILESRRKRVIE